MKSFIAYSGGVESTTMCLLYGASATPVFTDTGFEHKPLYAQLDRVEAVLSKLHGPQFKIIRIRAENVQNTGTDTLPDYIRHRKFYPNSGARFCTRLFKIKPMDDFLAAQGECEVLIGLNADEEDDRLGNYGEVKTAKYRYPLIEEGITRAQCEAKLEAFGIHPHFPSYMSRGGCVGCFYKRKNEYRAMAILAPDEAMSVAELEEAIQDRRGTHYSIQPSIPNMREFIRESQTKELFDPKEMYQAQPDGKGCGVFCHR